MKILGTPRNFPDLPKLWDGVPVRWEAWEKRITGSIDWHLAGSGDCEGCGLASSLWQATGLWRAHDFYRHEIRDLHATRCGWCGHTTVFTMHDEQAWTLDESDYGEADANTLF